MLGSSKLMAFVPTRHPAMAKLFYEEVLGLRFLGEDQFALALDANGIMIRIAKVPEFTPAQFTILGWQVADIQGIVSSLREKGVRFERYGFEAQDELGIWSSPSGAKVAWFKDPDGNVLSVTQFP